MKEQRKGTKKNLVVNRRQSRGTKGQRNEKIEQGEHESCYTPRMKVGWGTV